MCPQLWAVGAGSIVRTFPHTKITQLPQVRVCTRQDLIVWGTQLISHTYSATPAYVWGSL